MYILQHIEIGLIWTQYIPALFIDNKRDIARNTMKKSRISQHGSLLVALTSAQGLLAPYAFAVSDDYIISDSQSDVQISTSYNLV